MRAPINIHCQGGPQWSYMSYRKCLHDSNDHIEVPIVGLLLNAQHNIVKVLGLYTVYSHQKGLCTTFLSLHVCMQSGNMASNRQEEAIRIVSNNHNLLLTGQAGSGKSRVLKELIPMLRKQGKQVAVLCTMGMAAIQMQEYNATTIHRYCRININNKFN